MIRWEAHGRAGLATIDRQERRNALSAELCAELVGYLRDNADKRAVVITGAGSAFCAGADLVTRFARDDTLQAPAGSDTFRPAFDALLDAIVDYPGPVIAAVNGAALGAGMQLAVACDLRVVAPRARLGIPAGKLGVHLTAANLARLAQLAGQSLARDVLIGHRVLTGDEAFALGLAGRIAGDAAADALAWAQELVALAPLTLAGHKRALNLLARSQGYTPEARREVDASEAAAFASSDLVEGMAAFAEKRDAEFEGH